MSEELIQFKEVHEIDLSNVLKAFSKAREMKEEESIFWEVLKEENLLKKKDEVINCLCEQLAHEQYKSNKFKNEVDSLKIEIQLLIQELNQYKNISVI
jgi:hypothetical protein